MARTKLNPKPQTPSLQRNVQTRLQLWTKQRDQELRKHRAFGMLALWVKVVHKTRPKGGAFTEAQVKACKAALRCLNAK